jgi:hypothetical protein
MISKSKALAVRTSVRAGIEPSSVEIPNLVAATAAPVAAKKHKDFPVNNF